MFFTTLHGIVVLSMIPASEAEAGSEASEIARNRDGIMIPEKLNMEAQRKL